MNTNDPLVLRLWLHREEADAWLVSTAGVGAGSYLPKTEISIEDGHPVPVMMPVGPVKVTVPRWLAADRGLWSPPDPNQSSLF